MGTLFFILSILFLILWLVAKSKATKQEKAFKVETVPMFVKA